MGLPPGQVLYLPRLSIRQQRLRIIQLPFETMKSSPPTLKTEYLGSDAGGGGIPPLLSFTGTLLWPVSRCGRLCPGR